MNRKKGQDLVEEGLAALIFQMFWIGEKKWEDADPEEQGHFRKMAREATNLIWTSNAMNKYLDEMYSESKRRDKHAATTRFQPDQQPTNPDETRTGPQRPATPRDRADRTGGSGSDRENR